MQVRRVLIVLGMASMVACVADITPEQERARHFETLTKIERAAQAERAANQPSYLGIETRLLEGDLVSFLVTMESAVGDTEVAAYAECAAAQYAVIRGYGFARHVRTNVSQYGSRWEGDAVYTISAALPGGVRTLDAEVTLANCRESGIPTV